MAKDRSVRWVVGCALGAAVVAGSAAMFLGGDEARAQASEPVEPAPPPGEPVEDGIPRPNTQYVHSPGWTAYEDMPVAQRQGFDRAAEWKETHSGTAVHQAWTGYSAAAAEAAALDQATRAAGVNGLADVGVE